MGYILVIDDERSLLDSIEYALKIRGYEVFTSTSVSNSYEIVKEKGIPAVVLSDLDMPGEDVFPLLKELKGKGSLVIAMSGWEEEEDMPVDEFLHKPFRIDKFIEIINKYGKNPIS